MICAARERDCALGSESDGGKNGGPGGIGGQTTMCTGGGGGGLPEVVTKDLPQRLCLVLQKHRVWCSGFPATYRLSLIYPDMGWHSSGRSPKRQLSVSCRRAVADNGVYGNTNTCRVCDRWGLLDTCCLSIAVGSKIREIRTCCHHKFWSSHETRRCIFKTHPSVVRKSPSALPSCTASPHSSTYKAVD